MIIAKTTDSHEVGLLAELLKKFADSDDRVVARLAELRSKGEQASARVVWKPHPLGVVFEVQIRREDGTSEGARLCSDCGAHAVELWSPYARYCYRCGSQGAADVDAPWLEAIDGLEKELVLFAVHHRDIDLVPRALRWLQASSRS